MKGGSQRWQRWVSCIGYQAVTFQDIMYDMYVCLCLKFFFANFPGQKDYHDLHDFLVASIEC